MSGYMNPGGNPYTPQWGGWDATHIAQRKAIQERDDVIRDLNETVKQQNADIKKIEGWLKKVVNQRDYEVKERDTFVNITLKLAEKYGVPRQKIDEAKAFVFKQVEADFKKRGIKEFSSNPKPMIVPL